MLRSTAPLISACINLQIVVEILSDLPPLEGVFLHWYTQGVKSTTSGIDALFTRRKQLLGSTTLSGASIRLLYECATDCLSSLPVRELHSFWDSRPLHARLVRHGPSLSAVETQQLLPPGVLVQQTGSLRMADTLLLCTSVGPHMLTRHLLRAIATALALPRCTVKSCTVNPSTDNTVEKFAMQLGMLSPFMPPSHDTGVTALVLPPWPKRWEAKAREVAIAFSLWESLLLPARCLPHLLRIYALRADSAMRVIELASEDTADGQVDTPIVQLQAAQLERGSDSTYWNAEGTSTDAGECQDSAWVILGRHRFRLTGPWHRVALRC